MVKILINVSMSMSEDSKRKTSLMLKLTPNIFSEDGSQGLPGRNSPDTYSLLSLSCFLGFSLSVSSELLHLS